MASSGELWDAYGNYTGQGYLNVNASGYLKNCEASTIRANGDLFSSLNITTNYQDGQVDNWFSGVYCQDSSYYTGYEWSEDYVSIHRTYSSHTSPANAKCVLSEN